MSELSCKNPMGKGARPVTRPAARRGWLGGTKSVRANHGKLWDCKATELRPKCDNNGYVGRAAFCLANHWKRWDAKPGASGHFAPRSTGCTANQWKHWDAKPEAKGCAGLLAPHWGKRGRNTLRSIGYRTLCVRQNAKRGIKHEKFI